MGWLTYRINMQFNMLSVSNIILKKKGQTDDGRASEAGAEDAVSGLAQCPIGHQLVNFTLLKKWVCNACLTTVCFGDQIWGCEVCEDSYDVCRKCSRHDGVTEEVCVVVVKKKTTKKNNNNRQCLKQAYRLVSGQHGAH